VNDLLHINIEIYKQLQVVVVSVRAATSSRHKQREIS